jgi:sarcosine oxidase, subunit beta
MTRPCAPFRARHSIFSLARNALSGHKLWPQAWRSPALKPSYDAIIIGGGGHGLATAYYLAKNHGITNVAVLEKGWLGGGNTARNTTALRSNYFYPASAAFYDFSLKMYESLSQELNYNIMLSQRGMLTLAHSPHEMEMLMRSMNAMHVNGIDCELLTREDVGRLVPNINWSRTARFPIAGALLQRRAGVARHDAVAWGYARAADAYGVDIIQQCEVTGIRQEAGRVIGVQTSRGYVSAPRVGIAVAGHSSLLARMAGFTLPIESCTLQAFVSEPVKPVLDTVLQSSTMHVYLSQSDKGELVVGGAADSYHSYAQRGSFPVLQRAVRALVELFPAFSRLRLMRQWGGVVDMTPDRSPIIGPTPIDNLYFSGGWGTGGFKAIPAGGFTFAELLASGRAHRLIEPFGLDRFSSGALIDESAASGVAH